MKISFVLSYCLRFEKLIVSSKSTIEILEKFFERLEMRYSKLEPRYSILDSFEDRGSSFESRLSTYICMVLYLSVHFSDILYKKQCEMTKFILKKVQLSQCSLNNMPFCFQGAFSLALPLLKVPVNFVEKDKSRQHGNDSRKHNASLCRLTTRLKQFPYTTVPHYEVTRREKQASPLAM